MSGGQANGTGTNAVLDICVRACAYRWGTRRAQSAKPKAGSTRRGDFAALCITRRTVYVATRGGARCAMWDASGIYSALEAAPHRRCARCMFHAACCMSHVRTRGGLASRIILCNRSTSSDVAATGHADHISITVVYSRIPSNSSGGMSTPAAGAGARARARERRGGTTSHAASIPYGLVWRQTLAGLVELRIEVLVNLVDLAPCRLGSHRAATFNTRVVAVCALGNSTAAGAHQWRACKKFLG
jgi:hypothetical protein